MRDPLTGPDNRLHDHDLDELARMEINGKRRMQGQQLTNRELIRRLRMLRCCPNKDDRWRAVMDRGIEILSDRDPESKQ